MILRSIRTAAMGLADHCQMMAGLIGIGTGVWLSEKGIIKEGRNMGGAIASAIIGAIVSFPVTIPLACSCFLLNRVFWTFPLRKEAEEAARSHREAEKVRLAVSK